MTNTSDITTIRIKKTTRDLIDSLGQRREPYDEIIQRIAQFYIDNKMKVTVPNTQS